MNVVSVILRHDVYDRVLEIREILEDRLDREFTLDEIVNIILKNVDLYNL